MYPNTSTEAGPAACPSAFASGSLAEGSRALARDGTPLAVSSDARVDRCTFGDAVRMVLLNEPASRGLPSGVTRQRGVGTDSG